MANLWMVRAGEGGYQIDNFVKSECVGIGWDGVGDMSGIHSLDEMRARIKQAYPGSKPGSLALSAGMAYKFRGVMHLGDRVVTYDPEKREYLLGTIVGDYEFRPGVLPEYPHLRKVTWDRRVARDSLSPSARNTLGSVLTVFEPGDDVLSELEGNAPVQLVADDSNAAVPAADAAADLESLRRDMLARAHEFIKDRILALSPDDMEELVAALLRAMGYKARVTPKGPDRGRDVIASPDGLGFQSPRIVAEVKHRPRDAMGSERVRSFTGGMRSGDRGLYVSTGGFTKEAKYEADRATVPVTLMDLDDLASFVVDYYDRFDADGRSLLPLVHVYWPS